MQVLQTNIENFMNINDTMFRPAQLPGYLKVWQIILGEIGGLSLAGRLHPLLLLVERSAEICKWGQNYRSAIKTQ